MILHFEIVFIMLEVCVHNHKYSELKSDTFGEVVRSLA
jgi:hypothetical protein